MIGERRGEEGRKGGKGRGGRGLDGGDVTGEGGNVPGRIIVAPSASVRSAWFSLAGTGSYQYWQWFTSVRTDYQTT